MTETTITSYAEHCNTNYQSSDQGTLDGKACRAVLRHNILDGDVSSIALINYGRDESSTSLSISVGLIDEYGGFCIVKQRAVDVKAIVAQLYSELAEENIDIIALNHRAPDTDKSFLQLVTDVASSLNVNYTYIETVCLSVTLYTHIKKSRHPIDGQLTNQIEFSLNYQNESLICRLSDGRIINTQKMLTYCQHEIDANRIDSIVVIDSEKRYTNELVQFLRDIQMIAVDAGASYTYIDETQSFFFTFELCNPETGDVTVD